MFRVGQKVLCIRGTDHGNLIKDRIYTIDFVFNYGLWLKETEPSPGYVGFRKDRFVPLEPDWVDTLISKILQNETYTHTRQRELAEVQSTSG